LNLNVNHKDINILVNTMSDIVNKIILHNACECRKEIKKREENRMQREGMKEGKQKSKWRRKIV
jgi:hypothetical protein